MASLTATVPLALAQHGHGQGEEHGKPVEFKMPTTYKAAVAEIEHRLHEIDELIQSKQLAKVHAEADVIQKVAKVVGQLAAKPDSGVPKDGVKEINLAGKDLAGKFDAIDKAGDSGDLAGTQKVYDEMLKITGTLKKYVPKEFACPMKCEGDKTYPAPGKCPKCGMALQEVKSDEMERGEHGGVLLESADHKHYVEATLLRHGELRVYGYDEHEKPITADKFTATCRVSRRGAGPGDEKPVALVPGSDKSFLTGNIDPSIKTPLTAKVTIDFKDGQKSQTFQFDFDEPTMAPSKMPHGNHREGERKNHKP
jgi:hypothetical protein